MNISELNRRQLAALTAAFAVAWQSAAGAKPIMPIVYPGEELTEASGYPALVRFVPGEPGLPLVVFVTGGGVLGRIAYGPPAGKPEDFLCHWLQEEGFASLALSYPIDSRGLFDVAFPQFSITDWAEQSAEIIARYVDGNGLVGNVIVLGWSMAGRIAEPLHAALRRRGKGIELFIPMAAACALPNILPGLKDLQPAPSGLASIQGAYIEWLLQCLADQNRIAGRTVLDAETFRTEMTDDFPVGLAASAMRFRDGAFVSDVAMDAHEIGAAQYGAFPPLALMTHASALDARHALTDQTSWGFFITQQLCETHIFSRASNLSALPPENWALLVQYVRDAAGQLSVILPGNHMFFVGEEGARRTVSALKQLRETAARILRDITRLTTA